MISRSSKKPLELPVLEVSQKSLGLNDLAPLVPNIEMPSIAIILETPVEEVLKLGVMYPVLEPTINAIVRDDRVTAQELQLLRKVMYYYDSLVEV